MKRCPVGHPMVTVPVARADRAGVRPVCLACLRCDPGSPVKRGCDVPAQYTMSTLILHAEMDEAALGQFASPDADQEAVDVILAAAPRPDPEGGIAESIRTLVRLLSRQSGEPVGRVMALTPRRFVEAARANRMPLARRRAAPA